MGKRIIHIQNVKGHRGAYLKLFKAELKFDTMIASLTLYNLYTLIEAEKVFFATVGIGGNFKRYFFVSVIRAILRKPTCTLLLGGRSWLNPRQKINIHLKRLCLFLWKRLHKQNLLSIIPYHLEPRLSRITNDYIYDPQLWDMYAGNYLNELPKTKLSEIVKEKSCGRKILIFLGKASKRKGIIEFVNLAKNLHESVFIVTAGIVPKESEKSVEELQNMGVMVEKRFITEDEFLSLYRVADYIWCYYKPEYDQTSGVFGRAVQLNVIPIIRKNSLIDKVAEYEGFQTIKLCKNDFKAPKNNIEQIFFMNNGAKKSTNKHLPFKNWKMDAVKKIKSSLYLC